MVVKLKGKRTENKLKFATANFNFLRAPNKIPLPPLKKGEYKHRRDL